MRDVSTDISLIDFSLGIISEQQQKEPQWTASPHSSVKDYLYCENSYHCTFEPPEGDMKAYKTNNIPIEMYLL